MSRKSKGKTEFKSRLVAISKNICYYIIDVLRGIDPYMPKWYPFFLQIQMFSFRHIQRYIYVKTDARHDSFDFAVIVYIAKHDEICSFHTNALGTPSNHPVFNVLQAQTSRPF